MPLPEESKIPARYILAQNRGSFSIISIIAFFQSSELKPTSLRTSPVVTSPVVKEETLEGSTSSRTASYINEMIKSNFEPKILCA